MTWIRSIHDSSIQTGAKLGKEARLGALGTARNGPRKLGLTPVGVRQPKNAAQRNEQGLKCGGSLSPYFFPAVCAPRCVTQPTPIINPQPRSPPKLLLPQHTSNEPVPFSQPLNRVAATVPSHTYPFSLSELYGKPVPETPTLKRN